MRTAKKLEGTAYSYIRFSAKEQERGDSIRRQLALRDAWLERHPGITLDESLTLRDLGVSAFRGLHRKGDTHALGQFLRLVETGRVAPGSVLLVENLDRLSREDELAATHMFTGLLLAGITVVQLEPETVFDRDADQLAIMRAVLELGRAHAESARKSVRVSAAWDEKKRRAGEDGKPITAKAPAWLELVDDKFQFRPGALELLRRMVTMCRTGHGCRAIAAALMAEKVTPWGGLHWEEAYIRKVIAGREILGEYQPFKRNTTGKGPKRVPHGEPIRGYFPAAVSEKEWFEAQAARKLRDKRGGRPPKEPGHVNVFGGMLTDARTGKAIHITGRTDRGQYYRVLVPAGYKRHGDPCCSFPWPTFEEGVLSQLAEVDPRSILHDDAGGNEVLELSGRLAGFEGRIAAVKAQLVEGDGDVTAIMDAVRELEARRKEAADLLAAARLKAANPLAESWGEARGLLQTLRDAADQRDARVRLRSAIRRIVDSVHLLFVPRGDVRLCVAQVMFQPDSKSRLYFLWHRNARDFKKNGRRPVSWGVWSGLPPAKLADEDAALVASVKATTAKLVRGKKARAALDAVDAAGPPIDLRRPEDVALLADLLERLDLAAITG